MRKTTSLIGAVLLAVGGLTLAAVPGPQDTPPADAPANPDEAQVRAVLKAFVEAYNAADAQALSALFTAEGGVVDSSGATTRGRDALAAMYAEGFANAPGLTLEGEAETIRFLTPEVAQIEGQARLSGGGAGDAVERSRFSVLAVKRQGDWRLSEIRDYPTPPAEITSYDRLRELEWMVGDWVDESENARVTAVIRWAENQSFLIRSYSVEIPGEAPKSGTMIIGWDPQTGQIKSWVFDSEGGHGEGLWTRTAENQWVVKAHGVVRDGRPNSATQIHTIVSKDVVKSSSIDRIIGGVIAPDVAELIMVRQPPLPAAEVEVEGDVDPAVGSETKPAAADPGK
ncbi:MAG: SgcJ/EcaC family oxidoreductase [Isosphaeraceae bacterium]